MRAAVVRPQEARDSLRAPGRAQRQARARRRRGLQAARDAGPQLQRVPGRQRHGGPARVGVHAVRERPVGQGRQQVHAVCLEHVQPARGQRVRAVPAHEGRRVPGRAAHAGGPSRFCGTHFFQIERPVLHSYGPARMLIPAECCSAILWQDGFWAPEKWLLENGKPGSDAPFSANTTTYECLDASGCKANLNVSAGEVTPATAYYCADGAKGIICAQCVDGYYFGGPVEILQNTFSDRTRCICTATARILIPAESSCGFLTENSACAATSRCSHQVFSPPLASPRGL